MLDTLQINVLPLSSSSFCLEGDEFILLAFDKDTVLQGIRVGGMSSLLSKSYSVLSSVYTLSTQPMENFRQQTGMTPKQFHNFNIHNH